MFVILTAPEVRAVLDGSKTGHQIPIIYRGHWSVDEREDGTLWPLDCTWTHGEDGEPWLRCPYAPGSRVWVRETWATQHDLDSYTPLEMAILNRVVRLHYAATEDLGGLLRRSPVTMPRWASRFDLEITAVRIIRVDGVWHWDCDWQRVDSRVKAALEDDNGRQDHNHT